MIINQEWNMESVTLIHLSLSLTWMRFISSQQFTLPNIKHQSKGLLISSRCPQFDRISIDENLRV